MLCYYDTSFLELFSSLYLLPCLLSPILFTWFLMKYFIMDSSLLTIDASLICTKESVQCDYFHSQSSSLHLSCLLICVSMKLFCKNEYICICHSWINFVAKLNLLNCNKLKWKSFVLSSNIKVCLFQVWPVRKLVNCSLFIINSMGINLFKVEKLYRYFQDFQMQNIDPQSLIWNSWGPVVFWHSEFLQFS